MTRLRTLAMAVALVSVAVTAAASELEPGVAAVADLLGCSPLDRERLARGEIVSVGSVDGPWDEAAAVIVAASPAAVSRAMHGAGVFQANRRVLAVREIPLGPTDASIFASLPIDVASLANLRGGEPGAEWNLSVTERALLRDVERDGEGDRGLAATIRHIWSERTAAYRSGGTRAIASFVQPGSAGVFDAGSEAAALWARCARLDVLAPGIHAAVAAYPRPASVNLEHSYSASVVQLEGRPITVLSHRMESSAQAYSVAVEREFYVSRGYGVRQTVLGAAAISDGRAIAFYITAMAGSVSPGPAAAAGGAPSAVIGVLTALRDLGARAE